MAVVTMWETTRAFLMILGVAIVGLSVAALLIGDRH